MTTQEILGEVGGSRAALEPDSQHPRENGGVFVAVEAATEEVPTALDIDIVRFLDLTDEPIPGLDGEFAVIEELDLSSEEPKYYEAHGEVAVGLGTTHYKGYFPYKRTQDGIGYFFHGFGGFMKSSEPIGKAFAEQGLAYIVADQSHLSDSACEDLLDSQAIHAATAEAVFKDLAHNRQITHEAPDGKNAISEQWLLTAHSMGGLGSTRFAEAHPDETETLALLKTVGVNNSIILHIIQSALNGKLIGGGRHELVPFLQGGEIELDWKNVARLAKYFGIGWPVLRDRRPTRAAGEMLSCLFADTRESLVRIGEQGTKRIGIEAGRDPLVGFAFDFKAYVDKHVVFDKYGHLMPQHRPGLTAEAVLSAREDLRFKEREASAA